MRIPIIILTKERPKMLQQMLSSIERCTDPNTYQLILVDNASENPDTQKVLKEYEGKGHTVIYLPSNICLQGFAWGTALVTTPFFIISDPDIKLNPDTPPDWVSRMTQAMTDCSDIKKLGLALKIADDSTAPIIKDIHIWEDRYWRHSIQPHPALDICYSANIDTTLAMYRTADYQAGTNTGFWQSASAPAIRIGGRWTAEHLGWDVYNEYQEDLAYYRTRCNLNIAGTMKYLIEHEAINGTPGSASVL